MNVQHCTNVTFSADAHIVPAHDTKLGSESLVHEDGYLALYIGGFRDYRFSMSLDEVDRLLAELQRGRDALADSLTLHHDCQAATAVSA